MKKYILILVFTLLIPFLAKANTLVGFSDGNMYDPKTGIWQCLFLMDGNCYNLEQKVLTTRPLGSITPTPSPVPAATPSTVYVPVYINTPTPQPVTPATGGVSPTPSPVPPAQISDKTPPVITKFRYFDSPYYPNPIEVETNEPTTAQLYYLDYSSNQVIVDSYAQSRDTSVLNPILQSEGEKVTAFLDSGTFGTKHLFYISSFLDKHLYFLKLVVTDNFGNKTSTDWSWGITTAINGGPFN